jgi:hypothetical protein
MGITPKFTTRDVIRAMGDRLKLVENLIIRNLSYVGEHAVTIAREQHTKNYTDRTGNLRASVGYVIVKNGEIVFSGGFDPSAAGNRTTDGGAGAREGKALAEQLKSNYPDGFVLIVVAGMYYGVYVEKRDYNVVTFTSIEAKRKANELVGGLFKTV